MRRRLTALTAPPTREQWRIDGELHGHSIDQTIAYLADCADYADEQEGHRRSLPAGFALADSAEPRWLARLRRWTGRG